MEPGRRNSRALAGFERIWLLLVLACSAPVLAAGQPAPPLVVELKSLKIKDIHSQQRFAAKVVPGAQFNSMSEHDGRIIDVRKKLGAVVKKGEVMLVLQPDGKGQTFRKQQIKAAGDGVVTELKVVLGQQVNQGVHLFTIERQKNPQLELYLAASQLVMFGERYGIAVESSLSEEAQLGAEILAVAPKAHGDHGAYLVQLQLMCPPDEPFYCPDLFPLGSVVSLSIEHSFRQALVIPESALYDDEVMVVDEQKRAEPTKVVIGERSAFGVEVLEGLEPDQQVVIRAPRKPVAGSIVQVKGDSETAGSATKKAH